MPIIFAPENTNLKVTKVLLDNNTKRHLENLGILINANVVIISKSNGNVILKVKDGRVSINKETAVKIFVA